MPDDTIYALSSGHGKAAVGVVRMSGPHSRAALQALTRVTDLAPRRATLKTLTHGGVPIDKSLFLWFPGPNSFSGEDMVEFHVHGGRAVIQALSLALEAQGVRPATAGEFTKRAFFNGKVDLTEAEAIADLIDAETVAQQALALAQAGGSLLRLYEDWSRRLTKAVAYVEATLDFGDEDLPSGMLDPIAFEIRQLATELSDHLDSAVRGERLRNGVRIVILGEPNAGKSSLLNYLAGRDVAIVSHRAGTTRDVLEVHLDLGGYPVILADTAGLRETEDEIEAEGIARARAWAGNADIRLLLTETGTVDVPGLSPADCIVVRTKADKDQADGISVRTGQGITELLNTLRGRVADLIGTVDAPTPTRERHRQGLMAALAALNSFDLSTEIDLGAEALRVALACLGRITGRVDAEALLDVIFQDFCIGK